MKRLIFFIALLGIFSAVHAEDVLVTSFGARPDGHTMNTIAIQKAIDACNAKGGGKVIFPQGNFLTGTIEFRDNITLHFEKGARLLGSTNIEDYRNVDPFTEGLGIDVGWALLVAVARKNIGIEGEGIIDGQGPALKAAHISKDTRPEGKRWGRRPFLLRIVRCNNIVIKDVTLNYAGAWTSHYFQSRKIEIKNIRIMSIGVAHNDGIGIDGCQDVSISNCDVVSGDDALVFKTTSSKMACKNIVVKNMRLKSNQAGIKIGTESMAEFENIDISHCYIYDTKNGGIKLLSVDGAQIKNVTISNVKMNKVRTPILLRLGSRLNVFRKEQDTQQSTGYFQNVLLKDIVAISVDSTQLKSATGILITGVAEHKLSGITLQNITIELPGGGTADEVMANVPEAVDQYPEIKTFGPVIPAYGLWARHVKDITIKGLQFRLRNNDVRPAFFLEDANSASFEDVIIPSTSKAMSVVFVKQSVNLLFEDWKVAGTAPSFITADGASKSQIRLKRNELPNGQNLFR